MSSLRARQERFYAVLQETKRREERARYEGTLRDFVREAWPTFDSSSYQDSWAIDALCEHLTAVTRGHIRRLLVNYPPRAAKSSIGSICWPAWVWAQREETFTSGPNVRFLCASYGHTLSLKLAMTSRRLLTSPFYQHYWGDRFDLMGDQNAKNQFDNTRGGSRIATSVGGSLIGIGGDCLLVDDPHNTEQVESEAERETVMHWWRELRSTRLNDPKRSAIVCIMQRLHQQDVSGAILEDSEEWTHLMIPMRHDPRRHCMTVLKWDEQGQPAQTWEDPRDPTGYELMWPDRFGEIEVKALEEGLGPQMASGRLQQLPAPVGGGIFKEDWWGEHILPLGKPFQVRFDFKIASLDPAYTAKQENDPSGFTIWGVYTDAKGNPKIVLLQAWEKWLELHGVDVERKDGEKESAYIHRAKEHWGLVEWVAYECRRHNVDRLLIEDKASGHSVAQEFRRLHSDNTWGVQLYPVGTQDKRARAYSVQHLFSKGMIEAPCSEVDGNLEFRDWAQFTITQMARFRGLPGEEDNIVDSATQALRFLRDNSFAVRDEERRSIETKRMTHRGGPREPLYPV